MTIGVLLMPLNNEDRLVIQCKLHTMHQALGMHGSTHGSCFWGLQ